MRLEARQHPNPIRNWPTYQPLVLVVACFALGIALDSQFDVPWQVSVSILVFSLVLWCGAWLSNASKSQSENVEGGARSQSITRWRSSVLLLIGLVFAGSFWHHGRWNWFGTNEIGIYAEEVASPCCLEGTVISEPRWSVTTDGFATGALEPADSSDSKTSDELIRTRLAVRVERIRDGVKWRPASGMTDLVIHEQATHVSAGDRVRVFGKLVSTSPPSNPGQFDFQVFYRAASRIAFIHAYHSESVVVLDREGWAGTYFLSSLRKRLNQLTWRYVDDHQAPFASAIMLGNREQMSKERRDAFLETGTVHLLAISGLHVGILAGAFFLLFRMGLLDRRKCLLATILFVLFYAWLVEFRPPVSRAAILVTLFCTGRIIGERSFSFNLLAMAGLIVLLLNPCDLFGLGPQLSFLAVATLTFGKDWVFVSPSKDPIKRLIASTRSWPVRKLNWLGRQFRTAVLVSGLIWLVAMPLVAYRFHLLAPVALIVNPLLLLPIAWGLYGGLGVLVLGWFFPLGARVFGWICDRNLAFIEWLISVAQSVPCGHVWTAGPTTWSVITFYGGMFLFAIFPLTRQKGKHLIVLMFAWVVFGWLVPDQISQWSKRNAAGPLHCTFIDVGHGTSVLLQMPGGKNVLYDAGSFGAANYGARAIAGTLWHERIEHLDAVVLSHADVDHFNAMPKLIQQFSIGVVYVSPMMLESESPAVRGLVEKIKSADIPLRVLSQGDQLLAGDGATIKVLGPPESGVGENDNSNSVILSVEHFGNRLLLPGDLEHAGLSLLLETATDELDIVMAPHHGSKNSRPSEFIAWSSPEHVVISGGSQRVNQSTISRFQIDGCEVKSTAMDGAIRCTIDASGTRVQSWRDTKW